jgi:hypothetical protein
VNRPEWILAALALCACGRTGLSEATRRDAGAPSRDASFDAPPIADAGPFALDARADAGVDAGVAPSFDGGSDGGRDAGFDGGSDAGAPSFDGGSDAGPPTVPGCADGEREGFVDATRYPDIAGCAGGWDAPGVHRVVAPRCDRNGGDDGPLPSGLDCNVADLCAEGFHVCLDAAEVDRLSPDGCAGARDAAGQFFVTRQSGPGCRHCATGITAGCTGSTCAIGCAPSALTLNDVFGCGTIGDAPDARSCAPLDRFGNNTCMALPAPWSCGADGVREAANLVKPGPRSGGVLCCRD